MRSLYESIWGNKNDSNEDLDEQSDDENRVHSSSKSHA
jgi:hypothetical protein